MKHPYKHSLLFRLFKKHRPIRKPICFIHTLTKNFKEWIERKFAIVDYDSIKYQTKQSEIYPYWWSNFKWWDKEKINPIYAHKHNKTINNNP